MKDDSIPPAPSDPGLSALGRAMLGSETGTSPNVGPWHPPDAEELQKQLPQYEILRLLGRGGMGAVYQGRQISLDRMVAIKILSDELESADASFAERFKNEARSMAKLSHPGIVAVHDFGETSTNLLFIVMEFIEGTDVQKMIAASKRLHAGHAMAITAHVCDALFYAHERGIVHRDIKPANIMVGYDGMVKVADFGLAKINGVGVDGLGLTQSGIAMGTLHYMSPESTMQGEGVDHRADIYAVGVMLYHMLTGKLPQGIFKMPSLLIAGLDPRYDRIIGRAIMEDRDARYQSAREMRGDLDGIMTQPVAQVELAHERHKALVPTLPASARPQRPGGQPHPTPQIIVRTEMKSQVLPSIIVGVLIAAAAWMYLQHRSNTGGRAEQMPQAPPDMRIKSLDSAAALPPVSTAIATPATNAISWLAGTWTLRQGTPDFLLGSVELRTDRTAQMLVAGNTTKGRWNVSGKKLGLNWDSGLLHELVIDELVPASELTGKVVDLARSANAIILRKVELTLAGKSEVFNGHRYQWVRGAVAWQEAREKAENLGGHLATVTTREEHEWLLATYKHLLARKDSNLWLGAIRTSAQAGWKWVTNEPFVSIGWITGEPNDMHGGGGKVGYPFMLNLYLASDGTVGWNDSSTDISQTRWNVGFIVEWDSSSAPDLAPAPAPAASATTWIDTKGRGLEAVFQRLSGEQVLLEINGHVQALPFASFSADSQRIAQELQSALPALASSQERQFMWLTGRWHQTNNGSVNPFFIVDFMADQTAFFAGGSLRNTGTWRVDGDQIIVDWSNRSRYEIEVPLESAPVYMNGKCILANGDLLTIYMQKTGADASGWRPLFPHDSLDDWKGDTSGYRVENGIVSSAPKAIDLISKQEFGNFHLKFDLRLSSGANSGIGIWCDDYKGSHDFLGHTGFEIQLIDDNSPTYTKSDPWHLHGALSFFLAPKASPMGPIGSWNTHEIRMEGTRLTVLINTVTVIDQELPRGDPEPAGSRKHRLDFSKKRGHLVISGMRGPVDFRNMQIKELP